MVVVWLLAFLVWATYLCWAVRARSQCVLVPGSATRGQGGASVPTASMGRWLGERLARVAATILFLAQSRSTWEEGWQPDVAATAVCPHHPPQGSLKLHAEQAVNAVIPGVTFSLAREDSLVRAVDDDELLALPQQLINF